MALAVDRAAERNRRRAEADGVHIRECEVLRDLHIGRCQRDRLGRRIRAGKASAEHGGLRRLVALNGLDKVHVLLRVGDHVGVVRGLERIRVLHQILVMGQVVVQLGAVRVEQVGGLGAVAAVHHVALHAEEVGLFACHGDLELFARDRRGIIRELPASVFCPGRHDLIAAFQDSALGQAADRAIRAEDRTGATVLGVNRAGAGAVGHRQRRNCRTDNTGRRVGGLRFALNIARVHAICERHIFVICLTADTGSARAALAELRGAVSHDVAGVGAVRKGRSCTDNAANTTGKTVALRQGRVAAFQRQRLTGHDLAGIFAIRYGHRAAGCITEDAADSGHIEDRTHFRISIVGAIFKDALVRTTEVIGDIADRTHDHTTVTCFGGQLHAAGGGQVFDGAVGYIVEDTAGNFNVGLICTVITENNMAQRGIVIVAAANLAGIFGGVDIQRNRMNISIAVHTVKGTAENISPACHVRIDVAADTIEALFRGQGNVLSQSVRGREQACPACTAKHVIIVLRTNAQRDMGQRHHVAAVHDDVRIIHCARAFDFSDPVGRQRFFGKQRVIFGLTGTVCDLTVTQIPTCEDIVCTLWNSKVCLSVVSDILLRFIRRAGIIQVKADFHLCLTFKALLQVFERMACCNSRVNIIAQRGRKGVILLFCRSDRLHIGIVSADGFQRSLHFICIGFVLRRCGYR